MNDRQRRAIEFAATTSDRFAELAPPTREGEPSGLALVRARFHAAFAAAVRASYVLSVGEALAYAAFHVAAGFGHTGHLDLVAGDPELGKQVSSAITRHTLDERIRLHNANPMNVVPNLSGPYDLVMVDAATSPAEALYEHTVRLVRTGGSLVIELPALLDEDEPWLDRLSGDERLFVHVPDTESAVIAVRRR